MANITNEQKFKTAEERVRAFSAWCNRKKSCDNCVLDNVERDCTGGGCQFYWLALEADEEKPEPCPFCHGECKVIGEVNHRIKCTSCNYESIMDSDRDKVVSAHNRVARAVRAASEGDAK